MGLLYVSPFFMVATFLAFFLIISLLAQTQVSEANAGAIYALNKSFAVKIKYECTHLEDQA